MKNDPRVPFRSLELFVKIVLITWTILQSFQSLKYASFDHLNLNLLTIFLVYVFQLSICQLSFLRVIEFDFSVNKRYLFPIRHKTKKFLETYSTRMSFKYRFVNCCHVVISLSNRVGFWANKSYLFHIECLLSNCF